MTCEQLSCYYLIFLSYFQKAFDQFNFVICQIVLSFNGQVRHSFVSFR